MNENTSTSTPSTTATTPETPRTGLLSALRASRAAREAQRTMIRELAAYTSPADRADLDATLSRYDDEVAEVRRLVSIARHQAA